MAPLTTEQVATDLRSGRSVAQVDEGLRGVEKRAMVMDALNELRSDMKEILILRDVQGMSYEHIAELTRCSLGTVKSRVSRARMRFKDAYVRRTGKQKQG